MLSIGRLRSGQEDYYLRAVDQGADDYYTRSAEGQWRGRGAQGLGLEGAVAPAHLQALAAGLDPHTDQRLLSPQSRRSVPAFDLTLSAPKSVSLLYAFGEEGVRTHVVAGHGAGVGAALAYLEEHATVTRRGRGGALELEGDGLVAAEFGHRTSRAGDPQVHSHLLVANLTRATDGRYGALVTPLLYRHGRTAGFVYQAVLRRELAHRLGVEWTEVHNGTAEVAHIDQAWLRLHSRRRQEILERQAERGDHSARAAEVAALDTRKAKDYDVDPEALQQAWESRARAGGFLPRDVNRALERTGPVQELDEECVLSLLAGPEGLTARASSFVRRDVVRAVAEQALQGASLDAIEAMADRYLAGPGAVPIMSGGTGPDVPTQREEQRYSTPELLALEARVIGQAVGRADEGTGVAGRRAVAAVFERHPELSGEQRDMVERLLTSGAGVEVVAAKAGSGKTFALEAAKAGWEAAGHRVVGAALAARAAHQLERDAGIASSTLDRLLLDLPEERFPDRTVVVVDEAAMAGTRKLAELFEHADRAHTKVVLVGDPHQLPAIDAGGVLRGLTARLPTIELTENRRQRQAWERAALDQWRSGDLNRALDAYRIHGRFVVAENALETRARLVADWWQAFSAGESTMMLAPHRHDVELLNGVARDRMTRAGRLGVEAIAVGEQEFAIGDRVMARRNERRIGITNGTLGWVTEIDLDARQVTVRTDDERQVVLSAAYLDGEGERLVHGYATTIHKGQGATLDRTFVLGDDTVYRELGYSGASRHRDSVRFYVVEADLAMDPPHGTRDD
ncbi:MAG: relaxase domain-containing protein, partial [Acidimicrobiia bacterium]|nr:relaxase domain-containing protein [Acidimicrobiia bacterium]